MNASEHLPPSHHTFLRRRHAPTHVLYLFRLGANHLQLEGVALKSQLPRPTSDSLSIDVLLITESPLKSILVQRAYGSLILLRVECASGQIFTLLSALKPPPLSSQPSKADL